MGEIAEMMLDGMLCQCCGQFVNEVPPGYPVTCPECQEEQEEEPL